MQGWKRKKIKDWLVSQASCLSSYSSSDALLLVFGAYACPECCMLRSPEQLQRVVTVFFSGNARIMNRRRVGTRTDWFSVHLAAGVPLVHTAIVLDAFRKGFVYFTVYLMTLSVAQFVQHRIIGRLKNKLERMRTNVTYCTGICLEQPRRITKNLRQCSRPPDRDVNSVHSEFYSGVLFARLRR